MAPVSQAATQPKRKTGDPPRVLIAEDELLVAWQLEALARDQDLDVCGLVPDGEGAIEQAGDLDVDLVLMDIRLAGRMDGIEAARRIRESRDTPVTIRGDERASHGRVIDVMDACRLAGLENLGLMTLDR